MPSTLASNTLYLTLNYHANDGRENKYHWGLFVTDSSTSGGTLHHATNRGAGTGRLLNRFFYDNRSVQNPTSSSTMVVLLKICDLSSTAVQYMEDYIQREEPLGKRMRPPAGESDWTCRVWVKQVLNQLRSIGLISFPSDTNTIERQAIRTANKNIGYMGNARVINDVQSWLSAMDVDPRHAAPHGGIRR
ncbi:hypothetical protein VTK56DRAFT_8136 [Thermocarpiscus australiensis]